MATTLVYQFSPVKIRLFSHVTDFLLFQYICRAACHVSEWKRFMYEDSGDSFLTNGIPRCDSSVMFQNKYFSRWRTKRDSHYARAIMPFFRSLHDFNLAKRNNTFEIVNFNAELKEQLRSWLRLVKEKKKPRLHAQKTLELATSFQPYSLLLPTSP